MKGLKKGSARQHLLINSTDKTEWTIFMEETENVELARRNIQSVPMDLSTIGTKIISSKETVHCVELLVTWRDIVERKRTTCKNKQTSGSSGTDDKTKRKGQSSSLVVVLNCRSSYWRNHRAHFVRCHYKCLGEGDLSSDLEEYSVPVRAAASAGPDKAVRRGGFNTLLQHCGCKSLQGCHRASNLADLGTNQLDQFEERQKCVTVAFVNERLNGIALRTEVQDITGPCPGVSFSTMHVKLTRSKKRNWILDIIESESSGPWWNWNTSGTKLVEPYVNCSAPLHKQNLNNSQCNSIGQSVHL